MATRHDMEPLVHDWLHRTLDRIPDPAHRYPLVAAEISETPQHRGYLPPINTWRFQSMFSATKLVVAGAIVATVGVSLYTNVERQTGDGDPVVGAIASSPSPAAEATSSPIQESDESTAPPSDLADAGNDVDSGVLDTLAGRFEWKRIPGGDLPDARGRGLRHDLMEWHNGGLAVGPSYVICCALQGIVRVSKQ